MMPQRTMLLRSYQLTMSRRCNLLMIVFLLMWVVILVNVLMMSSGSGKQRESKEIKEEIIKMSVQYVKALADENKETIDGPYAGRFTGYDLKKTLAVLLENVLERLNRIETRFELTVKNGSLKSNETTSPLTQLQNLKDPIAANDLILGKTEECILTDKELARFPSCLEKRKWMRSFWKSDKCYGDYGVDGSECSIIIYLSEVEHWCPVLSWRKAMIKNTTEDLRQIATLRYDITDLMNILTDPGKQSYDWIKMRIQRMWPGWVKAIKSLAAKQVMTNISKKKILIHLGLLTKAVSMRFAEKAFKGGPLGELVQWSDVITCLYILGHDLTITHEIDQLTPYIRRHSQGFSNCPPRPWNRIDLIYTDILGLRQLRRIARTAYPRIRFFDVSKHAKSSCLARNADSVNLMYTDIIGLVQILAQPGYFHFKDSCTFRVVDSFGTEPGFNFDQYAKKHKLISGWGRHNLWPKQFYNMFQHSENLTSTTNRKRKNQALVYGKNEYMWEGKRTYLDIIHKYVDVHGTVALGGKKSKVVPPYVQNHDILSGKDLMVLLKESKLFIGLGFPYEGPAALEAIANGAIFLNPKFNPPHSGLNTRFFKGKPTLRELTSQHPYAENYIGEPYTFTVNISNSTQIEEAVQNALQKADEIQPHLPYEFTEEGNLQRINALVQNQDFCDPAAQRWPPPSAISYYLGAVGKSCKQVCQTKDLICEPTYLRDINSQKDFELRGVKCESITNSDDLYYPAIDVKTKACTFQSQELLYSCVGQHPEMMRVCACRDYIKGQSALCKDCL
ncbi:alpha-1,6-mannosylglycoprotein 6-beta-N-acetylglucosaminyltransferase A-like isoform X2 [Lineus longissimus]|uniref:alpha-1,6-mannosylglycoprotein 6-beta-N-acetylglucosaminyltransferase A-like isoform X2 n=1 Tax=Lineus longissimus TaxID=88925 RepID=UPI00315CF915